MLLKALEYYNFIFCNFLFDYILMIVLHADNIDLFYIVKSYYLWLGQVPLYMAFYCYYMVVVRVGKGIWRPLLVDDTLVVEKRLASNRTYSANGMLPSSIGIPLPYV
jgi:hypothetical protein